MKSKNFFFYVILVMVFVAFVMFVVYQGTLDIMVTLIAGGIVSLILFLVILKKEKDARNKQKKEALAAEALLQVIKKKQEDAKVLYEKVKDQETVSWQDILSITRTLNMIDNPPIEIIVKADWLTLIKVSKIKNRVTWEGDVSLSVALDRIKTAYDKCEDDVLLKKLIEKVKTIEKYSSYKGYDALRTQVNYRCQSLPLYLKKAEKRAVEEIENV